jgi:hypothetical protein
VHDGGYETNSSFGMMDWKILAAIERVGRRKLLLIFIIFVNSMQRSSGGGKEGERKVLGMRCK